MRLAGRSPVPCERRKWFQRKKAPFSDSASDFVPGLALVKSPPKPPCAEAFLNVLAQNETCAREARAARSPRREQPRSSCPHVDGASRQPLWSQRGLPCPRVSPVLPAELRLTCRGRYLTTTFLLHEHAGMTQNRTSENLHVRIKVGKTRQLPVPAPQATFQAEISEWNSGSRMLPTARPKKTFA